MTATVLILACGALAHELVALQKSNGWEQVKIQCLPAELHNTPRQIPQAVRDALACHRDAYEQVFVAYADCGTGGLLDPVLAEFGVERLPGAHCYEFFTGGDVFAALAAEEPGSYYLTDFLARHYERLVIESLGLDRHPELRDSYFGNYRRLVYLAQTDNPELRRRARACAERLGLAYHEHHTGLAPLNLVLEPQAQAWRN